MASSEDTEITLGTGKLLVLFFGLVAVCALFFALGYSLGRKSEPAITTASAAIQQPASTTRANSGSAAAAPPMTFYKSVEQKDANPQLTPSSDAKTGDAKTDAKTNSPTATPASATMATTDAAQPASAQSSEPVGIVPTAGYFVQVAAVSKQEDADALVDALKKKSYPAFVAPPVTADNLLRVQLGPFTDVKDAEAMRTKLIGDGYSPILKK
jgi:DedD protein